jgi:diguanylate cyclase (GGDEF)-like protein/PAS domain S-box-containing protein
MYRVLAHLTAAHDWHLVLLAVAICFVASITAVSLFHRAQAVTGRVRLIWLLTAGIATGCGTWATHFIAMLAFQPGVPVAYDVGLMIASLLTAIVVTTLGLVTATSMPGSWSAPAGGTIVGAGIACMHYLGMSALDFPGHVIWSLNLVAASIALGMLFGAAALTVADRRNDVPATVVAAFLLTFAITAVHFTGMGAAEVMADPVHTISGLTLAPTTLALVTAGVTVVILALSMVAAVVDARFQNQGLRLQVALDNMRQGLLLFDSEGRVTLFNERFLEMYKLHGDTLKVGSTLWDVLQLRKEAGTFKGDPDQYVAHLVDKDGHFRSGTDVKKFAHEGVEHQVFELSDGRTISVTNHAVLGGGWVSTHTDITDFTEATKELQRTKTLLNKVLENVPTMLAVKDVREQRYVLVNRAGEQLFAMPRGDIIGRTASDFFPKEVADKIATRDAQVVASGEQVFTENESVELPDGTTRVFTSKRLVLPGEDGKPQYVMAVGEDVTDRRKAERRIAHMAYHDPLTDLANRASFAARLAATLTQAEKTGGQFAVLCIDLDRFKEVNDVFGHSVGDELLKEVSRRLKEAAGEAFVARLGGDEFNVIVSDGPQPATAEALADRLLAGVSGNVDICGQRLLVGLSIGVAAYPADGADSTTIVANADAALYRAKSEGRGTVRFFDAETDKRLRDRRALQHDLRSAISRSELVVNYQPQARVDGAITGFEALVRWHHPTRGVIAPATFIPLADENGLIIAIGEWILREACREAASWSQPLKIAINLSPVQFCQGDLANLVHQVLLESGLPANRLELEITETVLIADFARALSILRRIKALGVCIAMDDFGTGYSSLSYLQSFPFDKIKIDRSFISNVHCNPQSAAIIRAVIGLGRSLDLPVLVEGVETKEQLAFLISEGCQEVQGFLIGKPLPIGRYGKVAGRSKEPDVLLRKAEG